MPQARHCLLLAAACLASTQAFLLVPSAHQLRSVQSRVGAGRSAGVLHAGRSKLDEELDSLRLDESKLDDDEKRELEALRRSYNLDEVLDFKDGTKGPLPPSSVPDDADYDPLDDAEDVAVEKTPWSGQAGLDVQKEATNTWADIPQRPILAVGDIAALTAFAAIGQASHSGTGGADLRALITAAPFVAGWLVASPLLGAYSPQATKDYGSVGAVLARSWVVAVPIGLALRGLSKGEVPPTPFIAVSMVMTLVLLGAWRGLYVAINGTEKDGGSKAGGLGDMFKMVTTLINRW